MIRLFADLPRPQRDPKHVSDVVHRIVSHRPYARPGPSFFERARNWVLDHLARLFAQARGTSVWAWLLVVVIFAIVAFLAWRFTRGTTRDRRVGVSLTGHRSRSARDWRAEAAAHEQAGEWRQALRCRYRALVADLATRGVLEEKPGRTAGEYRAELRGTVPVASQSFAGATALFERAWYGGRPAGADDAQRFRELEASVLEAAP